MTATSNHGDTCVSRSLSFEKKFSFLEHTADWLLSEAERYLANDEPDAALRAAHIAASVLVRQNRRLVSKPLEQFLQKVAVRPELERPQPATAFVRPMGRRVFLHVLEEALQAGGLTAMALRWIENHRTGSTHCVALLAQQSSVPEALKQAVEASGGKIWKTRGGATFIERAAWLRALTAEVADIVVLHVGVSDTVFAAALGRSGGPPVLLVNHAAHIFWVGATIADLVVNCRGSKLEARWTTTHRGARSVTVPIPLSSTAAEVPRERTELRRVGATKAAFGLPESALVILTVGARFKYERTNCLDFVASLERVLLRVPTAYLVAVGVMADKRWLDASARVGGRIHTLGPVEQSKLASLHAIADVYVDGFPFGTTTSLLEAGLRGVAAVLAPADSPPPYSSDGVALDGVLQRPASVVAFEEQLVELLEDQEQRVALGHALSASIRSNHTGPGWLAHLEQALNAAPVSHQVSMPHETELTDVAIASKWVEFIEQTDSPYPQALEHAILRALTQGLRLRYSDSLAATCQAAGNLRRASGIPPWMLRLILNGILPWLPLRMRIVTFRGFAFLMRHKSPARLITGLTQRKKHLRQQATYDVYRKFDP